jgi:NADPH-dependent 2,4-dienoyl-CoA reductase/sulfur reductase-like enzyme
MKRLASIADLRDGYDIVVIGAGPAGMAAAAEAGGRGLAVLLLDENPEPGGQIYRAMTTSPVWAQPPLRETFTAGNNLLAAFESTDVEYVSQATVWHLDSELTVSVSRDGKARSLNARRVIVATGALERPMPVPGWTLPGVMTVGGAQTLLKAHGLVPGGRVVLAGTGPLIFLYAAQCIDMGRPPTLVLDTAPRSNWMAALAHLPAFLASTYVVKGLSLMARVRRAVRVIAGVSALSIEDHGGVLRIVWPGGTADADHVLLHQGVVPHDNLIRAAGCAVAWNAAQACFAPVTDQWGDSTVAGIGIAGDGAGIEGADAAAAGGRIVALAALHALGVIDVAMRDAAAVAHRRMRDRSLRGRRFLDALYLPAPGFRAAAPSAIACRCEEVTGADIRAVASRGAIGPNQAKTFLRCGMGPCQGRLCGLTIVETLAAARGVAPDVIGPLRIRSPIKPVTLAEIASMASSEAEVSAGEP